MNLFQELCIETVGSCNRACPTCLRNSYPDKSKLVGRFGKQQRLPDEVFYNIIDQAVEIGFDGKINLQHYNEPLQDPRIAKFAKYARDKNFFSQVYLHTNGDLLTERKAAELDGVLNYIYVALYDETGGHPMPEPERSERQKEIERLFINTVVKFVIPEHMITHYSPNPILIDQIRYAVQFPCTVDVQGRMIIDYKGQMLLCCDDIVGLWDLGNIQNTSLYDLWFSERHQKIVETLAVNGGRQLYPYCRICPRVT